MTRTRALTAAAAAALVLGSVATAAVAHADGGDPGHGLCSTLPSAVVGTWRMTITPGTGHPFESLVSFQQGGTMGDALTVVPDPPFFAKAGITPNGASNALGSWTATGDKVTFAFERFITQDGAYVVRQHVEGWATVTEDCTHQTGSADVSFSTPTGTQIGPTVTVSTDGTRLMP